jgi:hypothetical protein
MSGRRLLKFKDLKARRIAENHPYLKTLIEEFGFPPGFWPSPNTHVWWEDEIETWLKKCPTERPSRAARGRR